MSGDSEDFWLSNVRFESEFIAALVSLAMKGVHNRPYIDCVRSFKRSDVIGGAVAGSG